MGQTLFRLRNTAFKHQVSHKYIDKGLESYAENLELISLKAQNYYHQDYIKEAIVWFNKLLNLGESSEFIHEKLSICYAKNYEYEKAIFHRKKVLDYNPYDVTSMYVIGTYYEELKDYEKAEEYISKSLKLQDKPLNDEYVKLGRIYNFQKKYEANCNNDSKLYLYFTSLRQSFWPHSLDRLYLSQ